MVDKNEILKRFADYFHHSGNVTVDDQGLVSVTDDVYMGRKRDKLPVAFDFVGDFVCAEVGLKTLEGAPNRVGRDVSLQGNLLTSLQGFPQEVGRNVRLDNNQLTDLKGLPSKLSGSLVIIYNPLTSLEGFPTSVGEVYLGYQENLPLLRTLGAQTIVLWEKSRYEVEQILNKYAGQGRAAAIDCKRDLVRAGFEGNARW